MNNPKDAEGRKKTPVSLLPSEGILQGAEAMKYGAFEAPRDGGLKGYGPYNWRQTKINYTIYLDATLRHALALVNRNDKDEKSGLSHWAHIIANASIVLDAIKQGCLVDDRPESSYDDIGGEDSWSKVNENSEEIEKASELFKTYATESQENRKHTKSVDLSLTRSGNECRWQTSTSQKEDKR